MDHSLCSKMTRRDFVVSLQVQHCHSATSFLQAADRRQGSKIQEETDAGSELRRHCRSRTGRSGLGGLPGPVRCSTVLLEASPTTPRDLRVRRCIRRRSTCWTRSASPTTTSSSGVTTDNWQVIHLGTRERVVFDLSTIKDHTRHPYRLQCEQYNLSPILFEHAKASGLVDIHLGAEVTEVGQDDGKVFARANRERRTPRIRRPLPDRRRWRAQASCAARYRFPLEGFTYEHSTTLITTPFRFEDEIPELVGANYTWTWLDAGSMFRLRDEWRCTFYPRAGRGPRRTDRQRDRVAHAGHSWSARTL